MQEYNIHGSSGIDGKENGWVKQMLFIGLLAESENISASRYVAEMLYWAGYIACCALQIKPAETSIGITRPVSIMI
jgi:hypothetical protein